MTDNPPQPGARILVKTFSEGFKCWIEAVVLKWDYPDTEPAALVRTHRTGVIDLIPHRDIDLIDWAPPLRPPNAPLWPASTRFLSRITPGVFPEEADE